jgi:hypothetical protein
MNTYEYIDANNETKSIQINIGGYNYEDLLNGVWELGFINENPGLDNIENDTFYRKKKDSNDVRCFKNKVTVKLCDGSVKTSHMIYWNKSNGYFCITHTEFWDSLDE